MSTPTTIWFVLGVAMTMGCADRLNEGAVRREESLKAVETKLTPEVRRQILMETQEWLRAVGTNGSIVGASSLGRDRLPIAYSIGRPFLIPRWNQMMIQVQFRSGVLDSWYVVVSVFLEDSCTQVGTEPRGRFSLRISERD